MGICPYMHIMVLDSKVKFFKALGDETRLTINFFGVDSSSADLPKSSAILKLMFGLSRIQIWGLATAILSLLQN